MTDSPTGSPAGGTIGGFTQQEWAVIRELSEDLPVVPNPFEIIAERLGMSEEALLKKIKEWQAGGVIRRFGATLKHYDIGYAANAMGVWCVEPDRIDEVGRVFASFRLVTHCYAREPHPTWPYNLYAMIHGKSREGCARIAARMAKAAQAFAYHLLFTQQELKKERMRYTMLVDCTR